MKKTVFVSVIAVFLAMNLNAQVDIWDFAKWQENVAFSADFDVKPEFAGGAEALFEYFEGKIQVPDDVAIMFEQLQGRMHCALNIDENGKASVVALISGDFSAQQYFNTGEKWSEKDGFEFMRNQIFALVKEMPNWTPAELNGKNVESKISFYVQYDLKESLPNIFLLDGKVISLHKYFNTKTISSQSKALEKNSFSKEEIKRNQLFNDKKANIMHLTAGAEE